GVQTCALPISAIAAAVNWLANYLLVLLFPVLQTALGLSWVMIIFAVLCLGVALFVHRFLPETNGKAADETILLFEGPVNREDPSGPSRAPSAERRPRTPRWDAMSALAAAGQARGDPHRPDPRRSHDRRRHRRVPSQARQAAGAGRGHAPRHRRSPHRGRLRALRDPRRRGRHDHDDREV